MYPDLIDVCSILTSRNDQQIEWLSMFFFNQLRLLRMRFLVSGTESITRMQAWTYSVRSCAGYFLGNKRGQWTWLQKRTLVLTTEKSITIILADLWRIDWSRAIHIQEKARRKVKVIVPVSTSPSSITYVPTTTSKTVNVSAYSK